MVSMVPINQEDVPRDLSTVFRTPLRRHPPRTKTECDVKQIIDQISYQNLPEHTS